MGHSDNIKRFHYVKFVILPTLLIIIGLVSFCCRPTPIVKNEDVDIRVITYNPNYSASGDELQYITEFDTQKIAHLLKEYKKYPVPARAMGYNISDVQLEISFTHNSKTESLILGKDNYVSASYGALKYNIINADELRLSILDVLNL